MQRIRHVPAGDHETIKVRLQRGRVVSVDVRPVQRLTTRASICEKFRTCAAPVLTSDLLEILQSQVLTLDAQPHISRMMAATGDRR